MLSSEAAIADQRDATNPPTLSSDGNSLVIAARTDPHEVVLGRQSHHRGVPRMKITTSDPVDSVLLSACVYLPHENAVPAAARAVAPRIHVRSDGTVAVTIGVFDIVTNDVDERQVQLEEVFAALWQTFVDAGFWPASEVHQEHILVSISLSPEAGQAGIALAPEMLRPWLDAGAQLNVNSYGAK